MGAAPGHRVWVSKQLLAEHRVTRGFLVGQEGPTASCFSDRLGSVSLAADVLFGRQRISKEGQHSGQSLYLFPMLCFQ